ncbi:MAG: hypothetical protein AAGH15_05240 [Myxococcota bacterium]
MGEGMRRYWVQINAARRDKLGHAVMLELPPEAMEREERRRERTYGNFFVGRSWRSVYREDAWVFYAESLDKVKALAAEVLGLDPDEVDQLQICEMVPVTACPDGWLQLPQINYARGQFDTETSMEPPDGWRPELKR